MVRMNKNSVGPQQRVEMRVLPYGGGSLCFSLLWLDRILEPKHLLVGRTKEGFDENVTFFR